LTTFITTVHATGAGPRLAVKDLIDVAGVPTTAGCRGVARTATPAVADAACLAGARAADARIVGKTNLHELAMLPLGTNPWFGTPVNPLDPTLIPGGSSSGSAVAVATGHADIALGSDTGGSIRVPSACCGTVGLKTTHGRVSVAGVRPLAPSLDTVGPMAASVAGAAAGMALLEPGFRPDPTGARVIGRLRTAGDPRVEAAVDDALRAAEFDVIPINWAGLDLAMQCFTAIFFAEAWASNRALIEQHPDEVGPDVAAALSLRDAMGAGRPDLPEMLAASTISLLELFDRVELLALPTLPVFPPRIDQISEQTMLPWVQQLSSLTAPFNPSGVPCTAQPIPVAGSALPASLQLVGPIHSEELLISAAARVERAILATHAAATGPIAQR
jgi:amidase